MPASLGAISQMASKTTSSLLGAGQLIGGLIGRHNNEKNLKNLANPTYTPNKAISDYYSTALNRYNTSPYQSNFYQQAQKTTGRNLATGIGALQDRRSAVGNIGALVQGSDDALDKAGVQAEGMRRQDFGQLGQAANMKLGDDRFAFDVNQEAPFERKYSELSGKLQANNQMINSGIQNFAAGLTGGGNTPNITGLGGNGTKLGQPYNPAGASYQRMAPVEQGGLAGSPAAGYSTLNPNAFSTL